MADRGNRGGGRGRGRGGGRFQPQGFPNRGGIQAAGQNHNQALTQQFARGQRGTSFRGGQSHGGQSHGGQSHGGQSHGGTFRGGTSRGGGRGGAPGVFTQNDQINDQDPDVTRIEDDSFNPDITAAMQRLKINEQSGMPIRPAYGSAGTEISLWANYFELLPSKSKSFHRYDVIVTKASPGDKGLDPTGKKLHRCVRLLLLQLPQTTIASDYSKVLITTDKFTFERREYPIQYYSEGETEPPKDGPKYKATVQYTGSFTFDDVIEYLSSTDLARHKPAARDEIIQAANIIIATGMKTNSQMITKRNKYFPAEGDFMERWTIAVGLEVFRGFFVSVRAATGRILLNVQVQHAVAWQSQSMSVLLTKLEASRMPLFEINRMISGVIVELPHLRNRIKRVTGLALEADGRTSQHPPKIVCSYANATQVEFHRTQLDKSGYITVADYFKETYKPLPNPQGRLLNVGTRSNPIYYPSELCRVKSLQTYDKMLSPQATEELRRHAVRRAPENAHTIVKNGLSLLQGQCDSILSAFDISVNPSMVTVPGRILPSIAVQYNRTISEPTDGSWNLMKTRFHTPAKVLAWTPLWIKVNGSGGHFQNSGDVDIVVQHLHATLQKCGMTAPKPPSAKILAIENAGDLDLQIGTMFKQIVDDGYKLILVILPSTNAAIYNAVKRAGDVTHGIHTVNVVADRQKFCKGLSQEASGNFIPNVQYHANVALKFNLKFGGRNHVLQQDDLGFIKEGITMLVGLDVTHPAPGSAKMAPSVSSIAASIDSSLGQWPADIAVQAGFTEMVAGLKNMFKSRLALWREHNNGNLPEELIVYRDGVGEGMYELVRTKELPLIREACKEMYPASDTKADKPYITIIICGKRHHTRFYPTKEVDAAPRTGGTKNGTIVDRGVTESRVWDFYFQAHTTIQGTPRSAHYVVIQDEIFRRRALAQQHKEKADQRAADEVQRMTNALSHMYGRATKAVSLCPPAYYADIVCERARAWLSGVFDERSLASSQVEVRDADVQVHPNLKDTMFYI